MTTISVSVSEGVRLTCHSQDEHELGPDKSLPHDGCVVLASNGVFSIQSNDPKVAELKLSSDPDVITPVADLLRGTRFSDLTPFFNNLNISDLRFLNIQDLVEVTEGRYQLLMRACAASLLKEYLEHGSQCREERW